MSPRAVTVTQAWPRLLQCPPNWCASWADSLVSQEVVVVGKPRVAMPNPCPVQGGWYLQCPPGFVLCQSSVRLGERMGQEGSPEGPCWLSLLSKHPGVFGSLEDEAGDVGG